MKTLQHPIWSYSLVTVQFGMIAALLATGPWLLNWQGFIWQIFGGLLGIWALQTMHLGRFNIIPDPKPDSLLVQAGPYQFIRHPMYASILLFFTPIALEVNTPLSWIFWGVLVINLWVKLHYEEHLLSAKFSDYADYQTRTKKLIPFIY